MYLRKCVNTVDDRTSFSVMSLVSRTARGREAIRDAGWESARDPSTHVFLPQDPAVLFQVIYVCSVFPIYPCIVSWVPSACIRSMTQCLPRRALRFRAISHVICTP